MRSFSALALLLLAMQALLVLRFCCRRCLVFM
jgi:hypothetical protein